MRRADVRRARLIAEAALVAAIVRVGVRVLPLPRVVSLLDRRRFRSTESIDVSACLTAAATGAARVAHPTCLYRSLIAFAMLARRGAPVVFHLGAAKTGTFEAHAWISVAGHVVGDPSRGWPELWQRRAADAARN